MLLRKGEVKPWGDKGGLRPPLAECETIKIKLMKTITLSSDDICIITLALLDKAMNIKNSAKICGITLSSQTLNKLAVMQGIVDKIND